LHRNSAAIFSFSMTLLSALAACSGENERRIPRSITYDRFEGTRAIGATLGSVLISICFVIVHYQPDMPHAAVFALFLLSLILCIAYLRTRALWLAWGLHYTRTLSASSCRAPQSFTAAARLRTATLVCTLWPRSCARGSR